MFVFEPFKDRIVVAVFTSLQHSQLLPGTCESVNLEEASPEELAFCQSLNVYGGAVRNREARCVNTRPGFCVYRRFPVLRSFQDMFPALTDDSTDNHKRDHVIHALDFQVLDQERIQLAADDDLSMAIANTHELIMLSSPRYLQAWLQRGSQFQLNFQLMSTTDENGSQLLIVRRSPIPNPMYSSHYNLKHGKMITYLRDVGLLSQSGIGLQRKSRDVEYINTWNVSWPVPTISLEQAFLHAKPTHCWGGSADSFDLCCNSLPVMRSTIEQLITQSEKPIFFEKNRLDGSWIDPSKDSAVSLSNITGNVGLLPSIERVNITVLMQRIFSAEPSYWGAREHCFRTHTQWINIQMATYQVDTCCATRALVLQEHVPP